MFRTWQLLLFALVPLALVFAGVIGGAFRGVDSDREIFPTAAPATPASGTPAPGGENVLLIAAKNLLFDKRTLNAAANTPITIRFDNQDAATLHNLAVYRDRTARTTTYKGDLVTGPVVVEYKFTTPAAGSYFFRCDVHPDTMIGTFAVK